MVICKHFWQDSYIRQREIEPLQLDFSDESDASARDPYGICTREGGGELDVAFDADIGGEDHIVVLIDEFHCAAKGVVRSCQRVAVEIEDGYEDGGTMRFCWNCWHNRRQDNVFSHKFQSSNTLKT